jgi:DNA topoisomerase-1
MVNNYIKEISKGDFTAKDFRTWAGTLQALLTLKESGDIGQPISRKQKRVAVTVMLYKVRI